MSEVITKLHENLYYGRHDLRRQKVELGDTWEPVEELLRKLQDNPDSWSECQSGVTQLEMRLATEASKMEYGVLSSQWWSYYFKELPKVRREMYHWQRPDRQEVRFYPYLNQTQRDATPDETGQNAKDRRLPALARGDERTFD